MKSTDEYSIRNTIPTTTTTTDNVNKQTNKQTNNAVGTKSFRWYYDEETWASVRAAFPGRALGRAISDAIVEKLVQEQSKKQSLSLNISLKQFIKAEPHSVVSINNTIQAKVEAPLNRAERQKIADWAGFVLAKWNPHSAPKIREQLGRDLDREPRLREEESIQRLIEKLGMKEE